MLTIALMVSMEQAVREAVAETNLELCREEAALIRVDPDDLCARRRAELDALRAAPTKSKEDHR